MKRTLLTLTMFLCATAVNAQWIKQPVNTAASFRGLSVVNENVIWASGTGGTVIRTIDGGKNWNVIQVPGAEKLDFRDVEAFDAKTAYILSIGNGDASRIYKTIDGGKNWQLQFTNKDEKAFFDAIACWDAKNCIAMSDPVDGHYVLFSTTDGENWKPIVSNQMPAAKDGEAAFAASGTCLIVNGQNDVYLVSGGTDARVFRSTDRGLTWSVAEAPIIKGTAGSGIFSIAMRDSKNGTIVGGNYEKPDERNNTSATTEDGGKTWVNGSTLGGYRSAAAYIDRNTIIAVGPNGSDVSFDRMLRWQPVGKENLNSVGSKGKNATWAVGPNGAMFKLNPGAVTNGHIGSVPSKLIYPHIANVTNLGLSDNLISPNCFDVNRKCNSSRQLTVRTTFHEVDIPFEILYTVSAGGIIGDGANVTWDLTGVDAGQYTITAGLSLPHRVFGWKVFGQTQTRILTIE